ncbi:hypothetical protein CHGG_03067 [Chaetomium globosum CBS 148.51]|uniref:Uncharacterized protein n=1 Tax=Chaetomium globosum (strain ATCC 6205 / CBS 148.51 / DSM 1962 / NBRC 6347 / NRRL 1970) TaxID=306901 RepID=Q2H9N7_CHAGB|nr:uncharacterized protein CHGG_03067 [Chaetomium globosum CBS 148.51]EAQ91132.1 hypothetical protein CHGG_03067 [Chaetomium globosum CBS 148.51]
MKRIVIQNPENDAHQAHNSISAPSPPEESRVVERSKPRQNQSLSPELMDILVPSLKVGAVAVGACGIFTGAAAGIIRSAPTVFFSVIAGGQWFTLGTTYYGGVAGTLGGMLRGPRNIIPGAVVFSLLGAGGQSIANWQGRRAAKAAEAAKTADAAVTAPKSPSEFWSRWSPIKQLSDQEYENILEEKLLRVEADIALIDDRVKELRESERRMKEGNSDGERNSAPSNKA